MSSSSENHGGDVEGDDTTVTIEEVRETVLDHFDGSTWNVVETALAAHATLLLDDRECFGLVVVGPSGSGKTTALRLFEDVDEVYRSDEATPASFVTQTPDRSPEDLEEIDLLPRIQHRTMLTPDLAKWFAGSTEVIQDKMATLAQVMDGNGLTRDAGSHGQRGYTGDYGFTFMGASTPLDSRAWDVMGHTGNRFVFHEKPAVQDPDIVADQVFSSVTYEEKLNTTSRVIDDFLRDLWDAHGGYRGVEWTEDDEGVSEDVKDWVTYFAQLVRHARSPVYNGSPSGREGLPRIIATFKRLAQAHALLYDRTEITQEDMGVCARVALSTMHKERRPVLRELLNPETKNLLSASRVKEAANISRPTALNRMKLIEKLGIGKITEGDGRDKKLLYARDEFEWPDEVDFPIF